MNDIKKVFRTVHGETIFYYAERVLNKNQIVKAQVQKIRRNLITIFGLISIFININ
tara:strand:- start:72 stop:239 length:168 start_codon:yes stop_codon:yes gene_type:complete